jgi:hypothetical protein
MICAVHPVFVPFEQDCCPLWLKIAASQHTLYLREASNPQHERYRRWKLSLCPNLLLSTLNIYYNNENIKANSLWPSLKAFLNYYEERPPAEIDTLGRII